MTGWTGFRKYSNWAEVHIRVDKDAVIDKDASEMIQSHQPEALKTHSQSSVWTKVSTKVQKLNRDKTKDRKRKQESSERGNIMRR